MRIGGATWAKGAGAPERPASLRHGLDSILVLAIVFCAGILGGCAGLASGSKTTTGGVAAFQVSPTSVNFGKVGVGKQTTQTVAVTNTGTMPVSITQATTSNPAFSLTGVTLPMTVATGQSGNFTVAVTPSTAGTLSGTLTVQGSDCATNFPE
jgi:Abnormal spindle-like microcephaly-assoc'd, ASPM-SPD-2-Hydin